MQGIAKEPTQVLLHRNPLQLNLSIMRIFFDKLVNVIIVRILHSLQKSTTFFSHPLPKSHIYYNLGNNNFNPTKLPYLKAKEEGEKTNENSIK